MVLFWQLKKNINLVGRNNMARTCKFILEYKDSIGNINLNLNNCNLPKHTMKRFIRLLKGIEDVRVEKMTDYPLEEIIVIVFLAVLGNANGWIDIANFAKEKEKWLRKFLILKNGIPSHDTFERVFTLINPKELEVVTVAFLSENIDKIRKFMKTGKGQKRLICVDGKEAKGTGRKYGTKEEIRNLQTLHVYDASYGICLYSEIINKKTNEIPVAQKILESMNLKDAIVTFDALNTQKKTINIIANQKGHYVGALKGNHEIFESEVKEFFSDDVKKEIKAKGINYLKTIEKSHNKIETRRFYLSTNVKWFNDLKEWTKLKSFICYEKTSYDIVTGKETKETRYYISSLTDVELCADSIRGHWGVENLLHWHLDANFYEDDNSTMDKNAFNNLSIINKMILSIMKLAQPIMGKSSIRSMRKKFSWATEDYLAKVLNAFDDESLLEAISTANKK
jgi:predicted transposase YbfD/YdcC